MTFQEFLSFQLLGFDNYSLTVANLLIAVLILIAMRFLYAVASRLIARRFARKPVSDPGRLFAFRQIMKYIIYTIGLLLVLQSLGVQLSVILAGAAALLVGIGLGVQQTFNDLVSGVILLLEGTVDLGDVLVVGGVVGKVTEIGIRTSKIQTRDDTSIIVPNSKLIVDMVSNWSFTEMPNRFQVTVGIAYGSDVDLATSMLIKAAELHSDVLKDPKPSVHFTDFGNSSLDFILHFYSKEYMSIPKVKSEIRYTINKLFQEADIVIPFPQRDVWMRS